MKHAIFIITLALAPALALAAAPAAGSAAPAMKAAPSEELAGLAKSLFKGLKKNKGLKLAVLEFPYAGGGGAASSAGPAVVQERLTTELAQYEDLTLIERALLNKVLAELKLQVSGAMDDDSVKKLGRTLGADAVVLGTLNDLKDGRAEVNARAVDTESGKILAAASAAIGRTWTDAPVGPVTPPKDFAARPLVQVAVLLDTSNSMDGLINQARTQLWKIVNELVTAEKSGSRPSIEVALYEYGNSALSRESGWVRQVTPFTPDLDKVSSELFALKTNGGEEYCGQVIKDAVEGLKWSPKTDVYKAIFIAGNEPFTQGPVSFSEAAAEAKAKGIFVNTIYCGSRQQGLAQQWKAAADLADGDYANIDQSAANYEIAAPQDDKIAQLSTRLGDTYVAYGASGAERLERKKAAAAEVSGAGKSVMAERAAFQAAAPSAARADASWDVVSAIESGSLKKEEVEADKLPAELRKLDDKARAEYLEEKLAERRKIKDEINRLQAERKAYISAEQKKASAANTLDKAMIDSIRKQATGRGYTFPQ
ncbi:MAG: FlgO family outer membrane protein [Elusimicrobia bacterium]|nr:FlgO family outer membrane protein [Elusimicrobiota bacterium]